MRWNLELNVFIKCFFDGTRVLSKRITKSGKVNEEALALHIIPAKSSEKLIELACDPIAKVVSIIWTTTPRCRDKCVSRKKRFPQMFRLSFPSLSLGLLQLFVGKFAKGSFRKS